MSKIQDRKKQAIQQIQDAKVKTNKYIVAAVLWFISSLYIYSTDVGFSDVYSWKPFVFFIVGPIFAAMIFGNIMFYLQRIIEKTVISWFAQSRPILITPTIVFFFFCFMVAIFIIIFKFAEALQLLLS
ncbi:MAG: hypothetical protein CMD88_01335 [Gammaproteobacteria bacterium]|nr:hypothetical protein [Gammaproteobacteria bacterium]|tara:strand:+ start:184400 stop:184783 length:384 start_codon:yes stop_codon:yes gene_type:complete